MISSSVTSQTLSTILISILLQSGIIVYGSDSCNHCLDFKSSLDSAGIKYVFYDIDLDFEKEKEMVEKLKSYKINGNIQIPVVEVNDSKLLIGADFKELYDAIHKKE